MADDYSEPDGNSILSFGQAQERAKAHRPAHATNSYTVTAAVEDYLGFLESDGRGAHTIRDTKYRAKGLILPKLGDIEVASLTSERLRRWRDELAKAMPRLRTKKGSAQNFRIVEGDNGKRARRSSTNRTWTVLRAALNHAFENGKASSDSAWRKVKPFKNVDAARLRYLTIKEAKRLVEASESDFRALVQAALQTGARYSELANLIVSDFNADVGTVYIRQSKSGKSRHIVLADEGIALFRRLTNKRSAHEPVFCKNGGALWAYAHQSRPMALAVRRAKIRPPISFHGLRHTWASHAVMNGVPLMVVARNLGHADTRMVEKHYGHLAPSYIATAIRAGAPRFES